jgi:hypothetical protein
VPAAYKNLVRVLAGMFYASKCPPEWWVDAADPRTQEPPDPDAAMWAQEKTSAQLAREAKRKAQVCGCVAGVGVGAARAAALCSARFPWRRCTHETRPRTPTTHTSTARHHRAGHHPADRADRGAVGGGGRVCAQPQPAAKDGAARHALPGAGALVVGGGVGLPACGAVLFADMQIPPDSRSTN